MTQTSVRIKDVYHPISLSGPFSGNRQQHSSPVESGFTSDVVYATKPDGMARVREWPKVETSRS